VDITSGSHSQFRAAGGRRDVVHWLTPGPAFSALLMALLLLSTLSAATGGLKFVGYGFQAMLGALSALLVGGYFLFSHKLPRHSFRLMGFFLLIAGWYVVSSVVNSPRLLDGVRLAQLAFVLLFFSQVQLTLHRPGCIRAMAYVVVFFLSVHFLIFLAQGAPPAFSSFYGNKNALGPLMFGTSFFLLIAHAETRNHILRKSFIGAVLLAIFLLLASHNRSAVLACLAAAGTYMIWPYITRSRKLFMGYLLALLAAIALVTFLIAILASLATADLLNALAREYTRGNLLSGREDFWMDLMILISERPYFGYGPAANAQSILGTVVASAHNLYLQLALQFGLVGLAFFLCLILAIWMVFWNGRKISAVRLSAAFFSGILVGQTFEVALTQNQIMIGLIYWTIIGIGVSRATRGISANKVSLVPAERRAENSSEGACA
jgi:O-antigen ligase